MTAESSAAHLCGDIFSTLSLAMTEGSLVPTDEQADLSSQCVCVRACMCDRHGETVLLVAPSAPYPFGPTRTGLPVRFTSVQLSMANR